MQESSNIHSGASEKHPQLNGIDMWRTVLLLLGIAFHAASLDRGWFEIIGIATHKFRMEAFFAISGLLGAMSMARQGPSLWLSNRLTSLGIPFIFVLFFVNQFSALFWVADPSNGSNKVAILPIGHLWFVVVLAACCFLFAEFTRSGRQARVVWNLQSFVPVNNKSYKPDLLLIVVLVGLFILLELDQVCLIIAESVRPNHRILGRFITDFSTTGARVPYYGVFYALGVLLATENSAVKFCISTKRYHWGLVIAGLLVVTMICINDGRLVSPATDHREINMFFQNISKLLIATGATLLIITDATTRVRKTNVVIQRISDSSYTVYLTHILFVTIIHSILARLGFDGTARYLVTFSAALALSYMTHIYLVKELPLAALLLNGKIPVTPQKVLDIA
ncbi:MAG: hypothetical protein EOO61_07610 [Hymenobacter sp.]|nr:MAG: hypothetical protein EOO61_07610 [Hymenobacter sp.]